MTTTDATGGGKFTLEPGEYQFRVVPEIEFGAGNYARTEEDTSQNGNPQIKLALVVGNQNEQVKVIERLTFTDKAAWRISSFLKAAGVYPGSGVDLNLTAAMCIGLTGYCETENMVPKGGTRERTVVKTWLPAPEQHPERLMAQMLDTPVPPPVAADEPGPYTDEVPFF
jgi:hypothetical protein